MSDIDHLDIVLQPIFLNGKRGRQFSLYVPPKNKEKVFLCLPSFAEEMNRCRVMVAMQARLLAGKGYGCLLLDYYGTGDSEGDFSDTSWASWHQDVLTTIEWLSEQGHNDVVLWGVRTGALLAAEIATESIPGISSLLFWQPVLNGEQFLTQFFRIRLAMLMDRGEPKESTQQMRANLHSGNNLEVAGYEITRELVEELDKKRLSSYQDIAVPINWFELVLGDDEDLSLASQKAIDSWRQNDIKVVTHKYQGPAFWQLHERELTPELLAKTTALFL